MHLNSELPPRKREFDSRRVLPVILGLLPADVVKSDFVVPISSAEGQLAMAVLENCDDAILDKAQFICNKDFTVAVVTEAAMRYAIERYCAQQ